MKNNAEIREPPSYKHTPYILCKLSDILISTRLSITLLGHVLRALILGGPIMSETGNHQEKKINEPTILSYSQSILVSYSWSERNQNVPDCFWQT